MGLSQSKVNLKDLPGLPLEKILGYLSLQECIKCRAVSRRWRKMIDSFRPKSLCYTKHPKDFVFEKDRWVSGSFVRNFVTSAEFHSFFQTFGHSILSNLKHLRLCDLRLDAEHATTTAFFAQTLNSFDRLEELDIIRFDNLGDGSIPEFELNLPMLNSIQLEEVKGIHRLTLDAPKLQNVKIQGSSSLNLDLVRVESIKKLIIDADINCCKMKNLKYLYINTCIDHAFKFDSTFLSGLEQLKEIHIYHSREVSNLFEQKQRYSRVDLKIFLSGCLLSGPSDPAIGFLSEFFSIEAFRYLTEHPSTFADHIPFLNCLAYEKIEPIPRGSEIIILNRFNDLRGIAFHKRVQNIERFLDLLQNLDNIVHLAFSCDQPRNVFDRLPDYCAVQKLTINIKLANFRFLWKLSHLIELNLNNNIDFKFIRKVFKKLKFLLMFRFGYLNHLVTLEVEHHPNRFHVEVGSDKIHVSDLDSAIRLIVEEGKRRRW